MVCPLLVSGQTSFYRLSAPERQMEPRKGHLRLGGTNPAGESISVNSYYLSRDGKPFIPVMGEMHFSRYPAEQWDTEIKKMKAGGVNVIPTYVFWSIHEEKEGVFDWTGDRDLRRFLQLCKENGMQVILRIGPFCHGEIRNGALPDWLLAKPLEVRCDDELYLSYVRKLYAEIAKQARGMMYGEGGPVIGCQIENEMQHAAAPWYIHYPDEPFDYTAAAGDAEEARIGVEVQESQATRAAAGEKHLRTLLGMAKELGLNTPLYTVTGWGNAATLGYDALPVTAGYTYPFWEATPRPSSFMLFKDLHASPDYAPVRYNPADYPSLSAEMGAGMQLIYRSRPIVTAEAAEALMVRTLGSGSNGIGYYVYHGGSTPLMSDGQSTFSDEPMGMPKISYDYQAPIGEYGLEGRMYRNLRLLHSFLTDFGDRLAPMETVLPDNWKDIKPGNRDDLRYAARMRDGRGFLFMVNFQDHDTMRHDMTGLRFSIELGGGKTVSLPRTGSLTLPKDASAILPLNFDVEGATLSYATAQPLMRIDDKGTPHYIFFAHEGMRPEYEFDAATVKGKASFSPKAGLESTFSIKTRAGKTVKITTLTREQALNAMKVKGRLLITEAMAVETEGGFDLMRLGEAKAEYVLYPSKAGFRPQTAAVSPVAVAPTVKKISHRKYLVGVRNLDFSPQVEEYYLRVPYTADVALTFLGDRLVGDDFFHGEPLMVGLRRHREQIAKADMILYFRPLRSDAPFLRDLPKASIPDFTKSKSVISVGDIEVVPQYRISVVIK